jgi:hypothetical protein
LAVLSFLGVVVSHSALFSCWICRRTCRQPLQDTIPLDEKQKVCPKLTVVSIAMLLADSIDRVHTGQSLSHLFEEGPRKFAKRRYSNNWTATGSTGEARGETCMGGEGRRREERGERERGER